MIRIDKTWDFLIANAQVTGSSGAEDAESEAEGK